MTRLDKVCAWIVIIWALFCISPFIGRYLESFLQVFAK